MLLWVLFPVSWVLPGLPGKPRAGSPGGGGRKQTPRIRAKPLLPPRPPFCKPGVPRREGRRAESAAAAAAAPGWPPKFPPPPLTFLREEAERHSASGRRFAEAPSRGQVQEVDLITGGCRRRGWNPGYFLVPALLGLSLVSVF